MLLFQTWSIPYIHHPRISLWEVNGGWKPIYTQWQLYHCGR